MADVRIFRPSRNVMQSASSADSIWHMEYIKIASRQIDPVMGWVSSDDVKAQQAMAFNSLDEAKQYCEKQKLDYIVIKPQERRVNIHPYAQTLMKNPSL